MMFEHPQVPAGSEAAEKRAMEAYKAVAPERKKAAQDLKSDQKELACLKAQGRILSEAIESIKSGTPTLDQIINAKATRMMFALIEDRVAGKAALKVAEEAQLKVQKRKGDLLRSAASNRKIAYEQPPKPARGLNTSNSPQTS